MNTLELTCLGTWRSYRGAVCLRSAAAASRQAARDADLDRL